MTKTATNTTIAIDAETTPDIAVEPMDPETRRSRQRWLASVALAVGLAIVALFSLTQSDTGGDTESVDVIGPGTDEAILASDGAQLTRRPDGLFAELEVPLPEPGSYVYPTADMIPPWAGAQPSVSPGASDAPEVFTVWMAVFNEGSLCTDGQCDADDLGAQTAALGGMYQLDGRVADGESLHFLGNVRLGQEPVFGAPLADPDRAEVHLLIAPHGRALSGADGWRQLNGPVGNPTLWWSARFVGSQAA